MIKGMPDLKRLALAAAAIALFAPAPPGHAGGLPVDPAWSAAATWDDGLAEVSVYEAERIIYGKPRPHTLTMIVVKEDFADDAHVKADPPYAGRELTTVLKLNLASTVPTENYPYHFLASIFVRRDDPRSLVKATVGSQEWCGNTFKEIVTWKGAPRLHFHSYFDGQADGEAELPLGQDGLLDEQMLLAVRAASIPEGGEAALRIADPLVANNARLPRVRNAVVKAGAVEIVPTALGPIRARRYQSTADGGVTESWWVEEGGSRALVKMESSDGRKMNLRERARRDYWSR